MTDKKKLNNTELKKINGGSVCVSVYRDANGESEEKKLMKKLEMAWETTKLFITGIFIK